MRDPGPPFDSGNAPTIPRRDFLQLSASAAIGLGLTNIASSTQANPASPQEEKACILIFNLGGMSHLDTFDPKPNAPREVRGPFKAIRTKSPEFEISELFPLHGKIADKFSLVRSCHHGKDTDHDSASFLMQTGLSFDRQKSAPHLGTVIGQTLGGRSGMPAHVLLPERIGVTGGMGCNASESALHPNSPELEFYPGASEALDLRSESEPTRERYGKNRLGDSFLRARRLVERGVRSVTVNSFTNLFNEPSWDIHGFAPFSSFTTVRDVMAPMYDQAYSALISDLDERGLFDSTIVAALSEFGRSPRINAAGGRDHWSNCFTCYFAGGGIQGGRAVGKSDKIGGYPAERPVTPAELVSTIYTAAGLQKAQLGHLTNKAFPIPELF